MEANINKQDVSATKPSLFGMITSPRVQFERMKTNKKVPLRSTITRATRWFKCVC